MLTVTTGLYHLVNALCASLKPNRFFGSERQGALLGIAYGTGYLGVMSIPNTFYERVFEAGPEQYYLKEHNELVVVPYFYGKSSGFHNNFTFFIKNISAYSFFPLLLLLNQEKWTLCSLPAGKEETLHITEKLPLYMGDQIQEFLGFMRKKSAEHL